MKQAMTHSNTFSRCARKGMVHEGLTLCVQLLTGKKKGG